MPSESVGKKLTLNILSTQIGLKSGRKKIFFHDMCCVEELLKIITAQSAQKASLLVVLLRGISPIDWLVL